MRITSLFIVMLSLFVSACSYKVPTEVSPATNIYSTYEDKIPGKFYLVSDSGMKNIHRDIKPSSYVCSAHSYPLTVDSSVSQSVRATLQNVFENIEEIDHMPTVEMMGKDGAQGVVFVKMKRFEPSIRFAMGFWSGTGIGTCDMVIEVVVKDKNNQTLVNTTVGGNRTTEGDSGAGCGGGAEVLSRAIYETTRDTMERLAERVANSTKVREAVSSDIAMQTNPSVAAD
ncbi:hypothetical protein dsat_1782 [Alkalidesulfovibrio alkalitolerans DSM 16529]|uniref:Lipoprotein n=1 Tax=Alkalidesulfovibrio alkalitolerans DSM 16529 TaxID=1121439 RepID=S7UQE7_9BACT|nr:hypothetical protein [Alkalidesulfovibrio alkalitolerans]EPR36254.1 hypothetical protein dsat_1782 [Alkalidesulfovibrio alkalitolerans DSM 16529]